MLCREGWGIAAGAAAPSLVHIVYHKIATVEVTSLFFVFYQK